MSIVVIPDRWGLRGGTAADLATVNEIPLKREAVIEDDTGLIKVGDGLTHWNSLPYINQIPATPCLVYTTETGSTADSDPGAGLVKWNNATQSSATKLFFDDATANTGTDLSALFSQFSTNSATGILHMVAEDGAFKLYKWTAVADGTGYFKFDVTHLASSGGNFADGITVRVVFHPMPAGGGGGGGNVAYVAQAEVTGSAATTLDVSGLDLATDQEYIVVIDVKNAAGSTSQISLYYNNDTTDANYRRAVQSNTGNTTESNCRIGGFASGETGYYECRIRSNINGRVSLFYNCYRETTTPVIANLTQATYWATVANLTKLTLSSSVASGLAIGTKITVYKRSH